MMLLKKIKDHIFTIFIALLTLASVALLWDKNIILFIMLLFLAASMLFMGRQKKNLKKEIKIFVFSGFSGAIAEIIAIIFGAWHYSNPTFLEIPLWLPVLWGISSVFIVRMYRIFEK